MVTMTENGLPIPKQRASAKFGIQMNTIMFIISQAVAWPIYLLGARSKYDAKISEVAKLDLGWLYLGLFLIGIAKDIVTWHAMIVRHAGCIMQPNMYGYKVMTPAGKPAMPYVLLEEDGDVGKANRAQRGIDNMMEYLPLYLAVFLATGYVFPFPMFINICGMVISRIIYAVKYAQAKEARTAGFGLFTLCKVMADGLVVLIAIKAIMKQV